MVIKVNIFTLYLFLISTFSFAQNTFIPDDNFEQALIDLGYDSGVLDDFVPTANINTIVNLDVAGKNISDLTGIEDFLNLGVLNCDDNNLTSLNITNNLNLLQLFCRNNKLSSLDTSKNTELNILWCSFNKISSLDITSNTKITSFICDNNLLTNIDVTQNLRLRVFICSYNMLNNLNVINNNLLVYLDFSNNQFNNIDVTNNINLTVLIFDNNNFTEVNVSKNVLLTKLSCSGNKLILLDVSKNIGLNSLICSNNELNNIDVSQNIELNSLIINDNKISTIDVTKNKSLTALICFNNLLCLLDVRNGNNVNFTDFNSENNSSLTCIFVDNIAYSSANWFNIDNGANFVTTQNECESFGFKKPNVDILSNVINPVSYTLPNLIYGNYYTKSGGNGTQLSAGNIITSSQTIYIYVENDCGINESSFNIIISNKEYYIPKYFTPNNDGNHDYWEVIDTNNTIAFINIFNQYGKLLKSLHPSQRWDGFYRGKLLSTNDYWYIIMLNSGETIKGHFALKR